MIVASTHLGRDREHQLNTAKVQNNKSQVSLASPRGELQEYAAPVFWDHTLLLKNL